MSHRVANQARVTGRQAGTSPASLVQRAVAGARFGGWLAWASVRAGAIDFYNSSNLTFAASIAFYTLLSLFPFLLLVLSMLSKVAIGPTGAASDTLIGVISSVFPSRFEFVMSQVRALASASLNLSMAGTLVTLWASMGVFGAITSAVNHAWGVDEAYGFFMHKLVAFLMMITAGVLAVAGLAMVGTVQLVESHWFAAVVERYPQLAQLSGVAYRNAPTGIFIVVVGLIFYFIPNAKVRVGDVWYGAMVTGILWRLAFAGVSWYVRDASRFSVDGSISAVVVFLLWVYLSSVILLYGAEVCASYARLRRYPPGTEATPETTDGTTSEA
jgi:membrane protein